MAQDLTDTELDELDERLAQTPEPLEPLDLVMLDGYLCGVLVQPRLIGIDEWLPPVFDLEGGSLPASTDPAWQARCAELIERRMAALNRGMAEDGWFDPILHELPEEVEGSAEGEEDPLIELPAYSRTLFGWVAGFQYATTCFPDLTALPDEPVVAAIDRVFRHLLPETDADRELIEALNQEQPLTSLDEAVEDLVLSVVELWDLTREQRFHVPTVKREAPKVGRNDPCPCGSGRKFKHCHGA
jgi:uncharacterized protein